MSAAQERYASPTVPEFDLAPSTDGLSPLMAAIDIKVCERIVDQRCSSYPNDLLFMYLNMPCAASWTSKSCDFRACYIALHHM